MSSARLAKGKEKKSIMNKPGENATEQQAIEINSILRMGLLPMGGNEIVRSHLRVCLDKERLELILLD